MTGRQGCTGACGGEPGCGGCDPLSDWWAFGMAAGGGLVLFAVGELLAHLL